MLRLQELDLSTLLSRDVLKEEDLEEEVEGMLRLEDNRLPSRALLVFSPDPELGLILRKLEEVEEGLAAPADSSSLLLAEPLSPDLRKEPEPPPGRHDMVLGGSLLGSFSLQPGGWWGGGHHSTPLSFLWPELELEVIICFLIIRSVASNKKQLLAD